MTPVDLVAADEFLNERFLRPLLEELDGEMVDPSQHEEYAGVEVLD